VGKEFHLLNRKASSIAIFSAKVWLVKITENAVLYLQYIRYHSSSWKNKTLKERERERNFYVEKIKEFLCDL